MGRVQVTIHDRAYSKALRENLERTGGRAVSFVEDPDPLEDGVIVVDSNALGRLPHPLSHPERVVLVTCNDPKHLAEAWNAGIRSVVFNEDPLSTAVLAIMAAELRVPKSDPRWSDPHAAAPLTTLTSASPAKTAGKEMK